MALTPQVPGQDPVVTPADPSSGVSAPTAAVTTPPPPSAFVSASDIVPPVPQEVTKVQAVLALHGTPGSASGRSLLDDVEAAVAAAQDPRIKLAWDNASTLKRHGLFVLQIAAGLKLSDTALDALFVIADGISV